MAVQSQSFGTIVSNAVAAVQGAATALVDFAQGSISLALIRAAAGIALWLQGIALQVAALTRFATSVGSDADSWAADYGFYRLLAVASEGSVTFARYTATQQAVIQAGTLTGEGANGQPTYAGGDLVQTADGTEIFQVIPDTTQSAYNATLNAYVIPASTTSCTATVQCTTAGTGGNVAAGLISVLGQSFTGVDTVTNASTFSGGANAETDSAFKARFVLYLQSLTEGTPTAVEDAVLNLQEGAAVYLTENYTESGVFQPSYFYCICDDGTGHPSSTFLSNCYNAIDKVRAVGTTFGVFGPTVETANVAMTISVGTGYTASVVATAVQTALTTFINTLPIGGTLYYTQLIGTAFSVPGVIDVTGTTLNSGTSDLTVTSSELVKTGSIVVNHT